MNERLCARQDCGNPAKWVLVDRFDVNGIKSVAFYDHCEVHKPNLARISFGHEYQLRAIEGQS
jgi:hypothetical protein